MKVARVDLLKYYDATDKLLFDDGTFELLYADKDQAWVETGLGVYRIYFDTPYRHTPDVVRFRVELHPHIEMPDGTSRKNEVRVNNSRPMGGVIYMTTRDLPVFTQNNCFRYMTPAHWDNHWDTAEMLRQSGLPSHRELLYKDARRVRLFLMYKDAIPDAELARLRADALLVQNRINASLLRNTIPAPSDQTVLFGSIDQIAAKVVAKEKITV